MSRDFYPRFSNPNNPLLVIKLYSNCEVFLHIYFRFHGDNSHAQKLQGVIDTAKSDSAESGSTCSVINTAESGSAVSLTRRSLTPRSFWHRKVLHDTAKSEQYCCHDLCIAFNRDSQSIKTSTLGTMLYILCRAKRSRSKSCLSKLNFGIPLCPWHRKVEESNFRYEYFR